MKNIVCPKGRWVLSLALTALFGLALALRPEARAGSDGQTLPEVDTALVISVDVSNSVDAERYRLQMEGIAQALEDPEVLKAILNGPQGGILVSLVTWADRPKVSLPWHRISSLDDAKAVAAKVRKIPREDGEFTCVTKMLRSISDKLIPQLPAKALRTIIDVSGDGQENCNPDEPLSGVRDELTQSGVTINGLPIIEGDEGASIEGWYRENVIGGVGAFVLPANGFKDFGRAIRQKFMIEISGQPMPRKEASAAP